MLFTINKKHKKLYDNAVTIKLNPLDRNSADEIILAYADKKGYKISYKVYQNQFQDVRSKVKYFFIINNEKLDAGIYNYKTNQLTYKAL